MFYSILNNFKCGLSAEKHKPKTPTLWFQGEGEIVLQKAVILQISKHLKGL